ncbi:Uncharacterized protein DAT39_017300, partial [Clarias magur]
MLAVLLQRPASLKLCTSLHKPQNNTGRRIPDLLRFCPDSPKRLLLCPHYSDHMTSVSMAGVAVVRQIGMDRGPDGSMRNKTHNRIITVANGFI